MSEQQERRFGRYEIRDLVGSGGMATVYRAFDPVLEREVAIKVLHPHLAQDASFVGRFQHEARAVAALRHPNIVRVYDVGVEGGSYFMVMEFIDGGTLATLLRAGPERSEGTRGLPLTEVLRLVLPLCSAIDYAAGQGMVHRDIKPANIMLTKSGDPVLTDYGIARMMSGTTFTASGMVMGSAHYMAPEQAQGLAVDVRADIYALGVVLFQMLTGRVPFDADTTGSILAQHIVAPIPSLAAYDPTPPRGLQTVLEKALAKDPAARYQTAQELGHALQDAVRVALATPTARAPGAPAPTQIESRPVTTPSSPGRQESPPREPRHAEVAPDLYSAWQAPAKASLTQRLRRHPGMLGAGAAAVALVAIVAGILGTRGEPSPTTVTTASLEGAVSSLISTVATAPFMTEGSTATTGAPGTADVSPQTAALRAEAASLLLAGKFNAAIAKYTEALSINPDDAAARTGLGIAYYHLPKSPQLAAQQLEAALALAPGDAQAWAFLGACRYYAVAQNDGNDYTAALQACNRALELNPNCALAHAFLGRIYSATDRREEALAEISQALSLAPSEPEVLAAAGTVRADGDDWDSAITYYKRAVTLAPNYPQYALALAGAYREIGEFDTALEYCRTALRLNEGYEGSAYRGLGRTLWDKGDLQGAKANLQKAIAFDDTDAMAHWALGAILYEQEEYPAALPELERAVALRPNNAGLWEWVGACYMQLERWEEARAALEKAVSLDPSRDSAQRLLDELTAAGH